MEQSDLYNLAYSCLIDQTGERGYITLEDAAYTLECWREEGNELAEETRNLNAADFMRAWNEVYAYFEANRRRA